MKRIERRRFKCIWGASAQDLTDEVDALVMQQDNVKLTYHPQTPLLVYAEWVEIEQKAETIVDTYNLKGIYLECGDCPHFTLKNDMRLKSHWCKYRELPARYDDKACAVFYNTYAADLKGATV